MKSALLVAFHFPPVKASSGLERPLSLVRHLPAAGWDPLVLTAWPGAYEQTSAERLASIPTGAVVRRAVALDAARHLAVFGRYPSWMAQPDRWTSWWLGAVPTGLAMIRRHRPSVIWSTYPITTAHYIGYTLHRLTGLPWIADFRDPMAEYDHRTGQWHPSNERLRKMRLGAETLAATHAAAMTFCTAGSRQICAERHPDLSHNRWHVVPNGFDEAAFSAAEGLPDLAAASDGERPITLLHSGTIYPTADRDPTHFLRALARVIAQRPAHGRPLRVILRGSGVEGLYSSLVRDLGLAGQVQFAPLVDYTTALREMLQVDGLLLFQGYTSNPAIPAKLYEYFRSGRPILALVDDAGDTAALLRSEQAGEVAPLDDEDKATAALQRFVSRIESGSAAGMPRARADRHERGAAARRFAEVFDEVTG